MAKYLRVNLSADKPSHFYHTLGRVIRNLFNSDGISEPDLRDPVQFNGFYLGVDIYGALTNKYITIKEFELKLDREQPHRFFFAFGCALQVKFNAFPADDEEEILATFHGTNIHDLIVRKKSRVIYNATLSSDEILDKH